MDPELWSGMTVVLARVHNQRVVAPGSALTEDEGCA